MDVVWVCTRRVHIKDLRRGKLEIRITSKGSLHKQYNLYIVFYFLEYLVQVNIVCKYTYNSVCWSLLSSKKKCIISSACLIEGSPE